MALTDDQKAAIQARLVGDLKQACLDLSAAAGEMFALFDAEGVDGLWVNPMPLVRMQQAYASLTDPLRRQAAQRLLALGLGPERLAAILESRGA